jgi:DNA repair protein RadC
MSTNTLFQLAEPVVLPDEDAKVKMQSKGATSLTDAEMLSLLIGGGIAGLKTAKSILQYADHSLCTIARMSIIELSKFDGMTINKAVTIKAAFEYGCRQSQEKAERIKITESSQAAEMIIPYMQNLNHEVFFVIYLNQANRVIKSEQISSGGMTGTVADLRMILKQALLYNSNQMIIAHNHPSGNLQPSAADKELTRKLKEAATFMDIKLLDHLIIGGSSFLSLSDEGYM